MPCSAGRATYTEKGERERERSEKVERDRERERETERGRASRSGAIINDIIRAEEKERGGHGRPSRSRDVAGGGRPPVNREGMKGLRGEGGREED